MDLKEVEKGKKYILHLVDTATSYTAAVIIDRKKKEIVVDRIFKIWLAYLLHQRSFKATVEVNWRIIYFMKWMRSWVSRQAQRQVNHLSAMGRWREVIRCFTKQWWRQMLNVAWRQRYRGLCVPRTCYRTCLVIAQPVGVWTECTSALTGEWCSSSTKPNNEQRSCEIESQRTT